MSPMSEPERPPLNPIILEQISVMLHQIDKEHFSLLAHYQVSPDAAPLSLLQLPKVPQTVLSTLRMYAGNLFKAEADQYESFRNESNYALWLSKLAGRVIARVLETIIAVESANRPATLAYHGLTDDEIRQGLGFFLVEAQKGYVWTTGSPTLEISEASVRKAQKLTEPQAVPKSRLRSTIYSPSAVRKMEAHLAAKGIGLTDFASSAGTTDRTLRTFRNTGRVSRIILAGIAKAMGITKDELLK